MRRLITDEESTSDLLDTEISYPLVTVKIRNTIAGVEAKGYALCDPTDTWDENFGIRLAYSRAMGRLSRKLERYLIRQSKSFSRS